MRRASDTFIDELCAGIDRIGAKMSTNEQDVDLCMLCGKTYPRGTKHVCQQARTMAMPTPGATAEMPTAEDLKRELSEIEDAACECGPMPEGVVGGFEMTTKGARCLRCGRYIRNEPDGSSLREARQRKATPADIARYNCSCGRWVMLPPGHELTCECGLPHGWETLPGHLLMKWEQKAKADANKLARLEEDLERPAGQRKWCESCNVGAELRAIQEVLKRLGHAVSVRITEVSEYADGAQIRLDIVQQSDVSRLANKNQKSGG